MKKAKRLLLWVTAGMGLVILGMMVPRQPAESDAVVKLPLVLKSVQALGELHTAKHSYENVFEYKTSRQPAEWAAQLPGVARLVAASTQNTVLVSAKGEIEAGVDLARARVERSGSMVTVLLPLPKLYEPNVQARVHWQKSSPFWRDPNIALRAEKDAADRISQTSVDEGILRTAAQVASSRVKTLAREFGQNVLVKFE